MASGGPGAQAAEFVLERREAGPRGGYRKSSRRLNQKMSNEIAFEMAVSSVRFGPGVTREVGMDLADMKARHALVVTDPIVGKLRPVQVVLESLHAVHIPYTVYDQVRVEPTEESFLHAIAFAKTVEFDAIVAVGGGSTIDTAKAVNLYVTYPPEDFLDYVNPPIGKGVPVPGPLKPLIAIPTTAGTGSETTGVSIFDLTRMHAKTGIASRRLKPALALLDPENTRTMPPQVAASSGLDILSHAVESYTAIPYSCSRAAWKNLCFGLPIRGPIPSATFGPCKRCGCAPNIFCALFHDASDDEARANMILAASYAGVGFGNAGVHLL